MSTRAVLVQNLAVRFGDFQVLEELDFQVPENSFVAVVGPNGAGKSTLFKVLLGLVRPDRGTVTIFDREPGKVPAEWIGYVPQVKTMDRSFPALSIELVLTGLNSRWPWTNQHERMQKALEALDQVGARHLAKRSLGRRSGGELQRVCLARSFVRQPRLVMLDEPATGIDAIGEADMYRLLENYQKQSGATFLMITHDWHAATHHADYVLLMNRVQISFGSPEQALQEDNLRRAFGHIGHEHTLKFFQDKNE